MTVFCSTIIPTIGRSTLTAAVKSVLSQDVPADFEVIVVNDSGRPLAEMDWVNSNRVTVLNHQRRERSFARNAGAAAARGKYLHFLDDDDILLQGALKAFWSLDKKSGSGWMYGFYRTVDNEGRVVEELMPDESGNCFAFLVAGESIPFQVSLLNTELFFQAGGFDQDPRLIGVEDRELGRRLGMKAPLIYTSVFVAQIRIGEANSTTNWGTIAESDRMGREKILLLENTLPLLKKSSNTPYLDGRICRSLIASGLWNLKRKRVTVFGVRFLSSFTFFLRSCLKRGYWAGLNHRFRKM